MRFRLEATPEELYEKRHALIRELAKSLSNVDPELADILEKALPAKERELKFPVLQHLSNQMVTSYGAMQDSMLGEIEAVLAKVTIEYSGTLQKSGGPFIGPRGGKWADAAMTIPWREKKKKEHIQAFHGTTQVFDKFDPEKIGKRDSGNLGTGVYMAADSMLAEGYAVSNVAKQGGTPTVLRVRGKGLHIADFNAAVPALKKIGIQFPPKANSPERSRKITEWFQAQGYDGARMGNEIVVYSHDKLVIGGTVEVPSDKKRGKMILEYFQEHGKPPPWAGSNPTEMPPWEKAQKGGKKVLPGGQAVPEGKTAALGSISKGSALRGSKQEDKVSPEKAIDASDD